MNLDHIALVLGSVSTIIGATGLASSRVQRTRLPVTQPARDTRRLERRQEHASNDDLEALAFRVDGLSREMRNVRDKLSASEAHHERTREDLAGVREDVDELSRELLLAQVELNRTLSAYMSGQAPPAPRSRKR